MMKKLLILFLLVPFIANAITPTFICGFECGIHTNGVHFGTSGTSSFYTSTVKTGSRSGRVNPSATNFSYFQCVSLTSSDIFVIRVYVRFATLPNATIPIVIINEGGSGVFEGAYFNSSDNKIYPGYSSTPTLGSTGVSVTTNTWYRIDVKVNDNANPHTIDVSVDGTATTQLTRADAASTTTTINLGNSTSTSVTCDIIYDDLVISNTSGDYPIGAGFVNGYTVGSDGTHSGITSNDYERTLTGTDILNSTTDAYLLIDDLPLESAAGDWINMVAPVANSYTEHIISASASAAPRGVEIICGIHHAGTGTGNMEILLNDNGSTGTIYSATGVAGTTSLDWKRVCFTDPPSAASTWTLSGNGNFNAIRIRFGATGTVDANPDQYLDGVVFEAEFEETAPLPRRMKLITQNRFDDFKNYTK